MTLDRAHVTIASRVMLPAYPAFASAVGASLTFTPLTRLRTTPGFDYADQLISLRLWGVGFLLVAAFLITAALIHSRTAFAYGLVVMVVWMGLWSALLVVAAFNGTTSFSAWTWPAFVALACWASSLSLLAGES